MSAILKQAPSTCHSAKIQKGWNVLIATFLYFAEYIAMMIGNYLHSALFRFLLIELQGYY